MDYLKTIEKALKKGGRLHTFRSGGGLRVVRIERNGELLAYGEHPSIDDALAHAAEDFKAGGREYGSVYGGSKPHYLTGSPEATSRLDLWVLQGHNFDAYYDKEFVVELKGYFHTKEPEGILETVLREGELVWEARGYKFKSSPIRFANGAPGYTTEVVRSPKGGNAYRAHDYWGTKVGRADNLTEAISLAFETPEQETED